MTDGSNNGLLPYAYSYHHPYYGHLYAESTLGILLILPGLSLSLHGLLVISHCHFLIPSTYITTTTFVDDEEDPTAATSGD